MSTVVVMDRFVTIDGVTYLRCDAAVGLQRCTGAVTAPDHFLCERHRLEAIRPRVDLAWRTDNETHCHCSANYQGWDHCPSCGCEQYESLSCAYSAATIQARRKMRDLLIANLFDGSEGGMVTQGVTSLVDEIVDVLAYAYQEES